MRVETDVAMFVFFGSFMMIRVGTALLA